MLAAPPVEGRWINQPFGRYTLGDPRSVYPGAPGEVYQKWKDFDCE